MAEFGEAEAAVAQDAAIAGDSAAVSYALEQAGKRGRRGKRADDVVDGLLEDQRALIAEQRRHLAAQGRTLGLDHWSKRLRLALQAMTMAAGALVALALAWMAFDASRADGVVIKAFSVAPDLARRGVTGEVVASELLDKLTEISDRSQASNGVGAFGAGWGQNISLQIPETGISLSEVDQFLREKLGHEKRLTGEVTQNPDGSLAVTARLGARALPAQTGPAGELPALVARTAEALYRREQPQTYEQYLGVVDRPLEEREAVAREEIESRNPVVHAVGYGHLGNIYSTRGDRDTAERYLLAADAAHVGLAWPAVNLGGQAGQRGRYEASLRFMRRTDALGPHDPTFTAQAAAESHLFVQSVISDLLFDHATGLQRRTAGIGGDNLGRAGSREALRLDVDEGLASAHDGARAEADAEAYAPERPADVLHKANSLFRIAYARRDWAAMLERQAEFLRMAPWAVGPNNQSRRSEALAGLGRLPEADAEIVSTPLDCEPCVIVRGVLAEARGRRAEADHWFSEASRIAPSIPNGPLYWGRALLARGDAARAAVQFREAVRRSPRAEEALEGLGEALAAQGDAGGAVKQYAAANALTPKWGRLHLKWGEALAKLGDAARAKAQLQAAAGLDLTADERAEPAAQPT